MAAQIKIVRTDMELECPYVDRMLRDKGMRLVLLPENVSTAQLLNETQDADLILMCYTPITAAVINNALKLKGIVKYGVGIDAIDIDAAQARKIPVVNIPQYAEETVAEGAFALMIALAKKLLPIQAKMQQDGWAWPTVRWMGSDLAEKTLGLVGTGHIGRSMARMAGAGFRMRVLGFDPHVDATTMKAHGIKKVTDLQAMLGQCDYVSIHCVLNDQTHHLLAGIELACMKPSAALINVSRGAIVDESALLSALQSQQIAGAALDVFGREPLSREAHPLRELYAYDNVILFPHLTFYTQEAMHRLEEETLARCFEVLDGRPVLISSMDRRLRGQQHGVVFG
ncbi:MAG: NAD(P)-dependent oxidoreductase [Mariprofundaceae bacterium]|nr:NAD(P)-dependent oxidoreductase [Mariprofundaceae bacterium]